MARQTSVSLDIQSSRGLLPGNLSNVPLAINDLLVGGHVVANQCQDHHDNMLSNTDHIGACVMTQQDFFNKLGAGSLSGCKCWYRSTSLYHHS